MKTNYLIIIAVTLLCLSLVPQPVQASYGNPVSAAVGTAAGAVVNAVSNAISTIVSLFTSGSTPDAVVAPTVGPMCELGDAPASLPDIVATTPSSPSTGSTTTSSGGGGSTGTGGSSGGGSSGGGTSGTGGGGSSGSTGTGGGACYLDDTPSIINRQTTSPFAFNTGYSALYPSSNYFTDWGSQQSTLPASSSSPLVPLAGGVCVAAGAVGTARYITGRKNENQTSSSQSIALFSGYNDPYNQGISLPKTPAPQPEPSFWDKVKGAASGAVKTVGNFIKDEVENRVEVVNKIREGDYSGAWDTYMDREIEKGKFLVDTVKEHWVEIVKGVVLVAAAVVIVVALAPVIAAGLTIATGVTVTTAAVSTGMAVIGAGMTAFYAANKYSPLLNEVDQQCASIVDESQTCSDARKEVGEQAIVDASILTGGVIIGGAGAKAVAPKAQQLGINMRIRNIQNKYPESIRGVKFMNDPELQAYMDHGTMNINPNNKNPNEKLLSYTELEKNMDFLGNHEMGHHTHLEPLSDPVTGKWPAPSETGKTFAPNQKHIEITNGYKPKSSGEITFAEDIIADKIGVTNSNANIYKQQWGNAQTKANSNLLEALNNGVVNDQSIHWAAYQKAMAEEFGNTALSGQADIIANQFFNNPVVRSDYINAVDNYRSLFNNIKVK